MFNFGLSHSHPSVYWCSFVSIGGSSFSFLDIFPAFVALGKNRLQISQIDTIQPSRREKISVELSWASQAAEGRLASVIRMRVRPSVSQKLSTLDHCSDNLKGRIMQMKTPCEIRPMAGTKATSRPGGRHAN